MRRAVAVWAEGRRIGFNIIEPTERGDTVTTRADGQGPRPRSRCAITATTSAAWCSASASATCTEKRSASPIWGHVNAPMILGTLGAIEMGLKALGIPHGKGGVTAAVNFLGESVTP